jgi:hypothetical protein
VLDGISWQPDCSDLAPAKTVASQLTCPHLGTNHDLGTIGVVPTSAQRRIIGALLTLNWRVTTNDRE